jgi:hypothetical protein
MFVGVALKKPMCGAFTFAEQGVDIQLAMFLLLKKAVDIQRAIFLEICAVSAAVTLLYIKGYLINSFTQVVIDSS